MTKFKQILLLLVVFGLLAFFSNTVLAHGYVMSPASRSYQGSLEKNTLSYADAIAKYGPIINEPQSLEALKGFPAGGPPDGRIASANGSLGGDFTLDNQTADRWTKTTISTGINAFIWKYTAYHATAKWHYYMTKQGWDPNKPLTRADLELIGEIAGNGAPATDNTPHQINVPQNRQGYHIILAIWDIADTKNAFYNVIDVNVNPASGTLTPPNKPTSLVAEHITSSSASISWTAQPSATSYLVFRDGQQIKEVATPTFQDQGLLPGTSYTYKVVAKNAAGASAESESLAVKTAAAGAVEKPTAPTSLHSMGATENSIMLMWGTSTHSQGINRYQVFQNGVKLVETLAPNFTSGGLTPDTEYTFTVRAVSNNDQVSDASNELKVRTNKTTTIKPTTPANLHAMGVTENTISLMWGASSQAQGIKYYQVYQNGIKIIETAQTSVSLTGLTEDTEYSFVVRAVSVDDQVSDASNELKVKTNKSGDVAGQKYCGSPVYDQTKAYPTVKTKVFYNCKIWENKWYANPNERPGENDVWDEVSLCTEGPDCKNNLPVTFCGAEPYNAKRAYSKAKTKVFYGCAVWENQWYANAGEIPGQNANWKFVGNCSEGTNCNIAKTTNTMQSISLTNNTVNFPGIGTEKIREVSIYNMQGAKVLSSKKSGKINVDISSLQPGVYIVKTIFTDGSDASHKIIKK